MNQTKTTNEAMKNVIKTKVFKRICVKPVIGLIALILFLVGVKICKEEYSLFWTLVCIASCYVMFFIIIGIPAVVKKIKALINLEKRGLLKSAIETIESSDTVPFGNNAKMTSNFLYQKKKARIIIPCDEILWVYTTYYRPFFVLNVATKNLGIVRISKVFKFTGNYKQIVMNAYNELQKRNANILIENIRENRKKYKELRKNG